MTSSNEKQIQRYVSHVTGYRRYGLFLRLKDTSEYRMTDSYATLREAKEDNLDVSVVAA